MSTFDIFYLPLVLWITAGIVVFLGASTCVALIVGQMFRAGYEPIEDLTKGGGR